MFPASDAPQTRTAGPADVAVHRTTRGKRKKLIFGAETASEPAACWRRKKFRCTRGACFSRVVFDPPGRGPAPGQCGVDIAIDVTRKYTRCRDDARKPARDRCIPFCYVFGRGFYFRKSAGRGARAAVEIYGANKVLRRGVVVADGVLFVSRRAVAMLELGFSKNVSDVGFQTCTKGRL